MNKGKRLISNTLILGAGTFASKLIVLLMMPFYTAWLSPEQFGVADLVAQTANMIIPIACIGLSEALFRFALDCEDKKGVFSTAICALGVGTAALFLLLPILNIFDIFDGYILLIGAYVAFANIHSVTAHYVRAKGNTVLFAAQGILNTVLTVAFNILFLFIFNIGAYGYVLSVVLGDLLSTLVIIFAARLWRDFSIKSFSRKTLSELLRFSIPYVPTTMLWLITSVSDRYIVKAFCGIDETGLYAASYKIPTLLTLVATVFIEAWQFSAIKDADDGDRAKFFETVFRSYMGVMFLASAVLIGGSKIFTELLLDSSYYDSWEYIPVLVGATVFSTLVSFMGSVYFVEKKSLLSMFTALTGALINIILNFVMIPDHGAMGAALATLISYVAVYAVRVIDTRKYIRFKTHGLLLSVNCALIALQAAVMYSGVRHHMLMQVGFIGLMAIVNAKGIIETLKEFFSIFVSFAKKIKKY